MKLVEELKSHSSKWIKTKGNQFRNFYWQNGYGGFSVNPNELDNVKKYIQMQKAHHKKKTFKEEYWAFLIDFDIEFDENYVWD